MIPLLVFALLLAGCAPAPKPMPLGNASQSTTTIKVEPLTESSFYSISGTSFYVASKQHPVARFHYAGGAWCNVWADEQGLHWEACKPPAAAKHGWTDQEEQK